MPFFNRAGWIAAIVSTVLIFSVGQSLAASTIYDLTSVGDVEMINGAYYLQWDGQPTGTGVFDTFVEIGQPGGHVTVEDAYNTTEDRVLDNGSADQHNYSITLGDLSYTTYDSVDYAVFALDVNEDSGHPRGDAADSFLSLDDVQIFVRGTENGTFDVLADGTLNHDGDLVYRMGDFEENWVALDYSLNNGSGSGDMLLYVEKSAFDSYNDTDVVTLYSKFGTASLVDTLGDPTTPELLGDFGQSDGFEEWGLVSGTSVTVVPEPGSAILFGAGMLIVNRRLRRR
jgi:hypothetical protein